MRLPLACRHHDCGPRKVLRRGLKERQILAATLRHGGLFSICACGVVILDTNIRRVDIAALLSGSHTRIEAQWLSSHIVCGWPTNTFSQLLNRLQDPQRRSAEQAQLLPKSQKECGPVKIMVLEFCSSKLLEDKFLLLSVTMLLVICHT